MQTFTAVQIRGAFLRAADYIEQNPTHYEYTRIQTPSYDELACMWGHVGRELGLRKGTFIHQVAYSCGTYENDLYSRARPPSLYTHTE